MDTPPQFDSLAAVDKMLEALLTPTTYEPGSIGEFTAGLAARNDDPPSPAADLLDALITDSLDYRNLSDGLTFSGIHDTNPAGVGEAAVHVSDTLGHRYLLVAIPVEPRGALDNRSYVRRLLTEKMPELTRVIADVERVLDAELAAR